MRVLESFESQDHATAKALIHLHNFKRIASPNLYKKICHAAPFHSDLVLIVFDIDDTLLRNDNQPLKEVVTLFRKLRRIGAKIFLVTARHPGMRAQTYTELKSIGIHRHDFEELLITPQVYRTSMQKVGEWKFYARQSISTRYGAPIALTVGDQWTDIYKVAEKEMVDLDEAYPSPFTIGFVEDGYSLMFLKLKSMH